MRLGDVINVVSGYAFKSDLFNTNGEGIPIIRIRDISKEKASTYYSGEYLDEYIVNKGDFLVGMDGEFSVAEWRGGRSLLNQRVCKIVPDKNLISPRYLLKILPRELKKIEDRTPFVTVKHLSVKSINAIKLPVPPLPVQERIAAILDAADTLRQKDQALLKKYDELTQSLFLDMFGDPLTNPFGWDKVTLGDLLLEAKYGTSAKASDDGQYPYLRMNNITYNGYMDFSSLKYIDVDDTEKKKYSVTKGDILFNRTNSRELVGKTALVTTSEELIIAGYLVRLRVNPELANPYYVWRHLNSRWAKMTLQSMCKNIIGMANINAQEVQKMLILKAPLQRQNDFADRIEAIEKQRAMVQSNMKKSEELFQSLLQKAFKGELIKE